ncbi:calmodulin-binding protein [Actinomadura sp. KC216]|uniref:BP74-related protein n=1 Tax=Actinomadura sp. KC216 TaxID=2530370 RepID=UPI0010459DC1|nr:calmodulin-binding protein [Actinomadura sp. KC216]TDB83129.1 calmodulin-binding protein [Actinomadura sp. KC216]
MTNKGPRAIAGAVVLALSTLLVMAAAVRPADAAPTTAAYFVFTDMASEDEAVIKLTDPAEIQHARDLISGSATDNPQVMGKIVKQPASYNPGWSYHLDPSTIQFFEIATEVCDASIAYVEEHLDEAGGAFLPGLTWCPWGSRVIREIPA